MSSRSKPTMKSAQNHAPGKSATGREIVKQITAQVLRFEVDKPRVITIDDAMRISARKVSDEDKAANKGKGPATICTATDVDTGETGVIVMNKVMIGNLTDNYPDDSYVGLCFEVTKREKKKGGKFDYWPFDIVEVKAAKA